MNQEYREAFLAHAEAVRLATEASDAVMVAVMATGSIPPDLMLRAEETGEAMSRAGERLKAARHGSTDPV